MQRSHLACTKPFNLSYHEGADACPRALLLPFGGCLGGGTASSRVPGGGRFESGRDLFARLSVLPVVGVFSSGGRRRRPLSHRRREADRSGSMDTFLGTHTYGSRGGATAIGAALRARTRWLRPGTAGTRAQPGDFVRGTTCELPQPPPLPLGAIVAHWEPRKRCFLTSDQGMVRTAPESSSSTRLRISASQAASASRSGSRSRLAIRAQATEALSFSSSPSACFSTSDAEGASTSFVPMDRSIRSCRLPRRWGRPAK